MGKFFRLSSFFAAVFGFLACVENTPEGDVCDMLAGELVISEIMATPASGERDEEWFEVYNGSGRDLVLDRLELAASGSGDSKSLTVRGAGTIENGSYFVLGASELAFVDYNYGQTIDRTPFTLFNTDGVVSVSCRGRLIDEVAYGARGEVPSPETGVSLAFDGGVAPDALLNDGNSIWCLSTAAYDGVNFGSPGESNEVCGLTTCEEAGSQRDLRAPKVGDLVISELLSTPAGEDTAKEWIEIFVASVQGLDLNGIVIETESVSSGSSRSARILDTECVSAAPGSFAVFAASLDEEINGGVDATAVATGLERNGGFFYSSSQIVRLFSGTTLLDEAVVIAGDNDTETVVDPETEEESKIELAYSVMLDAGLMNSVDNDSEQAFCLATLDEAGFYESFGTPGAPNRVCGKITCMQEDGAIRRVNAPAAGDLVITEVLADAKSVSDGAGEFIEIYLAGSTPVELNGLTITNAEIDDPEDVRETTIEGTQCLTVTPGRYALVGQREDTLTNGGLEVDATAGLNFFNTDTGLILTLLSVDGVEVDTAQVGEASAGASWSLRPGVPNAAANGDPSDFCPSETAGVYQDFGTPGLANVCGASCLEAGGVRALRSPGPGDVVISEVMSDPVGADACRDWFEIYAKADVDLNGLQLFNNSDLTGMSEANRKWDIGPGAPSCISLPALSYAVIAGPSTDLSAQDVSYSLKCNAGSSGFTPNSLFYGDDSSLELFNVDGVLVDRIEYGNSPEGQTYSLMSDSLDADDNDNAANWCSTTESPLGDTPFDDTTCL